MKVAYKFTYEELVELSKFFDHQYISYNKQNLHAAVNKINRIVEAHKRELDKQSSLPTQGA